MGIYKELKPHKKEDCQCPYLIEPKYISRAYWICPGCERDVSLEYVILQGSLEDKK